VPPLIEYHRRGCQHVHRVYQGVRFRGHRVYQGVRFQENGRVNQRLKPLINLFPVGHERIRRIHFAAYLVWPISDSHSQGKMEKLTYFPVFPGKTMFFYQALDSGAASRVEACDALFQCGKTLNSSLDIRLA